MEDSAIQLHHLPSVTGRGRKRVGRGYGSGKGGHTSGRGQKGQRSRRTIQWWFEGGQLPLVKRVPFWRGKGRLNQLKQKPVIVKIGQLERLASGTVVTPEVLIREGMVAPGEAKRGIKILSGGKLTKSLTVENIALSKSANSTIESARIAAPPQQSTPAKTKTKKKTSMKKRAAKKIPVKKKRGEGRASVA